VAEGEAFVKAGVGLLKASYFSGIGFCTAQAATLCTIFSGEWAVS